MLRFLLTTLLCACLVLPAAMGQTVGIRNPDTPTPTTLYMHLINFQDFPINTQKPDDRHTESTALGLTTSTTTCLPDNPTGLADTTYQVHTFYGYSSPSYVEYLFTQGDTIRTHPERGISYDAELAADQPFTVYWYLSTMASTAAPGGAANPDMAPIPVPNVMVEATMRAGDEITVNDAGYNTGPIIGAGAAGPATIVADKALAPDGGPAANVRALGQQEDGTWLFEFAVPVTLEQDVIPRKTGYNLRVDVYMDNPACAEAPDNALMPNLVKVHSSADFRPRMELSVLNPIRLEYLHPQFVGDELVIHTSMNSVWGNYDVAEVNPDYTPDVQAGDIQIHVQGPSLPGELALVAFSQRTHDHDHHQEAVDVTYVWPYKSERAAPGNYYVTVLFRNDQGTAEAVGTAMFTVGKQNSVIGCGAVQEAAGSFEKQCIPTIVPTQHGGNEAPGPGFLLALAGAGLAVALRRRT